ncbi:MAG: prevent-host-death protein [Deltaproteobacteria bacterium RIFCSPHIGHO2_02_FULL_60_17]|nr:MAG: prevent-host-death protein [Deltaproteobacteria bacterium RIFCSPHIGHO2_02_FULL_60_17]OGQ76374.1 MAG: prevent-host-death protein [Deltaproteobacteria bacterium RIFCSPLOWO2_12_FULL_60_16]
MKVLPLSEVKATLGKIVDLVEHKDKSITITRRGRPVAVMLSKRQYDSWQETVEISKDSYFMKEIRAGIRTLRRTKRRYTIEELFSD